MSIIKLYHTIKKELISNIETIEKANNIILLVDWKDSDNSLSFEGVFILPKDHERTEKSVKRIKEIFKENCIYFLIKDCLNLPHGSVFKGTYYQRFNCGKSETINDFYHGKTHNLAEPKKM